MSNRCNHDRRNLRTCDIAKRGKGGQPVIIGLINALVTKSMKSRKGLDSWHGMNGNGCGRRSEMREAAASTLQYLFAKDYHLETGRCSRFASGVHVAPHAEFIAADISRNWGDRMSVWRVRSVIRDFVACGYVKLSHQQRNRSASGQWRASPKVIHFTKKFFIELGGKGLWRKLKANASAKTKKALWWLTQQLGGDEGAAIDHQLQQFKLTRVVAVYDRHRPPPDYSAAAI